MVGLELLRINALIADPFLKVALFLLIWAIAWLPIAIPVARVVKWNPTKPLSEQQKLILLASLYIIAPAIVGVATHFEGTSWQDYGLAWKPHLFVSLIFGTSFGVVGIFAIFACQGFLGWVQWHFERWSWSWLLLSIGLAVGFIEELIFRGFVFNEFQQYSSGHAAAISSLIFAGLHLLWEQKQTLKQLPGLWLMGMVLVEARFVDGGSLGLAWGLHAGWIWGLATLESTELVTYTEKASAWITGLEKQPLAGAAGILGLLVTGGVLFTFSQL